eukprot:Rhum_TRINITY_DN3352_c0_g1::Rhum_TRINITY_DN3352_c0_g1_i1::g.10456::m.10456/K14026/SEL1, SEL1L; SEL1 protein
MLLAPIVIGLCLGVYTPPDRSTDFELKQGFGLDKDSLKQKTVYTLNLRSALETCFNNKMCKGVCYNKNSEAKAEDRVNVVFIREQDKVVPLAGYVAHVKSTAPSTCQDDAAKAQQQKQQQQQQAQQAQQQQQRQQAQQQQQQQQQAQQAAREKAIADAEALRAAGAAAKKKIAEQAAADAAAAAAAADADASAEADADADEEGALADDEMDAEETETADVDTPPSEESERLYHEGNAALYASGDDGVRNVTHAVHCFNESAAEGHAASQFMLGFLYSVGLGIEPSEMMAVLYYTFSALGGNADAAFALAYRNNYGYGVPRSCAESRKYYRFVADKVAKSYRLHAVAPSTTKIRLSDPIALRTRQKEEDLLQYYQYNADRGHVSSQMVLGYAFMWGIRGLTQDTVQACKYFELAADRDEPAAFGALGTLYAQGINSATNALERNYTKASEYFEKGVEKDHAVSLNGLGYLYMKGAGVKRNYTRAVQYFRKAAGHSNPEAQYNLGVLYKEGKGVERADKHKSQNYLQLSASRGQVLAHWQLGVIPEKPCDNAVHHLKTVGEQGAWSKRMDDAHKDYLDGDYATALVKYMIASEHGFEIAHSNAAFMLDQGLSMDEELTFKVNPAYVQGTLSENTTAAEGFAFHSLALKYYRKATEQGNTDAPVKVGDYHYYGQGADMDVHKALQSYKLAVSRGSHHAMFNLGYMHEHGISIAQSFELAKRYYDQAFQSSEHAYWPITLALIKLHVHWWFTEWLDAPETPAAASAENGKAQKAKAKGRHAPWTIAGHSVEDTLLGTLMILLFLTLFVRHTARQVQLQQPPAAAPAAAPQTPAAPAPAAAPAAAEEEPAAEAAAAAAAPADPPADPAAATPAAAEERQPE